MIPSTYGIALLLSILSMICWGSWANTFKLSGKWRFELFYFDYATGVLIAAVVAAFTVGSMGSELTFTDNLLIAAKSKMAWGLAAGIIFNLANMLLVAAISIAGMAVAFPVGIGLALVVGVVLNYALNPQGNPKLLGAGVALVVLAIILDAIAYAKHARSKQQLASANAPVPVSGLRASQSRSRTAARKAPVPSASLKGIVVSLVSGLLMGSFYPMVEMSKGEEIGLGPYTVAFFFAIGVFLSTFVFNIYFMNLPVEGEPVPLGQYLKGSFKQHALGITGGVIWSTGAIANFVAASAPKEIHVGPAISYAIGQGATLISALWGLLVWREFAGARPRVRFLLALMLILFVGGLALVSIAPRYER
ncbi:MAG: AcrB/AcrD/AcrF family protein [Acidobacteriota bacterium]|nr:AcrB/AcrD/AcrF family protein [Acidobacteriota bacterium]